MASPSNDKLISMIDRAVTSLLEDLDPAIRGSDDKQPLPDGAPEAALVGFSDRLKAIELGAKWVLIKNKIDAGDTEDEFSRLRSGHIRGSGGRNSSGASSRTNGSA